MAYRIEVSPEARRSLLKLPRRDQSRLLDAMTRLGDEPRPRGCRKLEGEERTYRIRVGVYRIIYDIFDDHLVIEVLRVGHRQNIYRR